MYDVGNAEEILEMPKYRLILGRTTVHKVDPTDDGNADIICFYMLERIMIPKRKN